MATITTTVLVIGAGPTGIGAAVRLAELGTDHLVVESGAIPGGMAASVHDEHGFTWDLGGHVIHSHFAEFDKAVAGAGTDMLAVPRNGAVWMGGRMLRTPIQQHLSVLPVDVDPSLPATNLLEFFGNNFGADLTSRFFRPHTEKMWAFPIDGVSHEWTSLRAGSGARNVPRIAVSGQVPEPAVEFFPYPAGGTGRLWSDIHRRLTETDNFRFNTTVTAVNLAAHTAMLSDGSVVQYETCVNTAPMTTAMRWALDVAPELEAQGELLATSAVHAIGLGYDGDPPDILADKTYIASPDEDVPWYRASVLSNYDPANAGPGRWSVLCETSTSRHRPVDIATLVDRTRASIEAMGADPSRLVSTWTRLVPMGYPIPTLGRDDALRAADDVMLRHGFYSRGRFGGWRYESCNQDYSFAQGVGAVQHAIDGSPEDVYWFPERF